MNTVLDERLADALANMAVLPKDIHDAFIERVTDLDSAIRDDLIDSGTIQTEFTDLNGRRVVLGMVVNQHFATMEVSTKEDGTVISHVYDFIINSDADIRISIDETRERCKVSHYEEAEQTKFDFRRLLEAKALMATLPMFSDCSPKSNI